MTSVSIVVLAGAVEIVPEGLTAQLARHGRLVVPVAAGPAQTSLVSVAASGEVTGRQPLFQWMPRLVEGRAQVL